MNIGIISSSGGSTFKAFFKILKKNHQQFNFFIITDRNCGILKFAKENGIAYKIIDEKNNEAFSKKAKQEFAKFGDVDFIVLFFTRLVTTSLFNSYPVFNLHPSILPAFRGFQPLKKAIESGTKYFGTTLHIVDEIADNGPIFAQAIAPMPTQAAERMLEKASYVQRVYLLLLLVDFYQNKAVLRTKNGLKFKFKNFSMDTRFNPAMKNQDFIKEVIKLDKINRTNLFV